MKSTVCPNGTGAINIRLGREEAAVILQGMTYQVENLNWDDYTLSVFRSTLEHAIRIVNEEGIEESDTTEEDRIGHTLSPRRAIDSALNSLQEDNMNWDVTNGNVEAI